MDATAAYDLPYLAGAMGLKATYGRVSEFGAAPLCWSVAHVGPLAATVADAALGYAAMAGSDPGDVNSLHQPLPTLAGWDNADLSGLRIGVFWPWFRHASAEVVASCEPMLAHFERMGAQIREVVIPDLEAGRVAHLVCVSGESVQAVDAHHAQHHKEYGRDVRLNLLLTRAFTVMDYVKIHKKYA